MPDNTWANLEELYHAARAQPLEMRAEFLAQACPDDPKLRAEVQSLLDRDGDSFLESAPASAINCLTAGTWLGNFEIGKLLGRGGMGEVYRARDTRLKREVALELFGIPIPGFR